MMRVQKMAGTGKYIQKNSVCMDAPCVSAARGVSVLIFSVLSLCCDWMKR